MHFFQTLSEFRQQPTDVTRFPHRQLAAKVFSMVLETYMMNWDDPVCLRPDVTPEMLEPCFSRIFGKTAMTEVVARIHDLCASYESSDMDDMYLFLTSQRKLLAKTATESAWGSPSTRDVNRLTELVFCILVSRENVDRFVAQAKKRINTLH